MNGHSYDELWGLMQEISKKPGGISPADALALSNAALRARPHDDEFVAFVIAVVQGFRDGVISIAEKDRFVVLSLQQAGTMKWTLDEVMRLIGFITGIVLLLLL